MRYSWIPGIDRYQAERRSQGWRDTFGAFLTFELSALAEVIEASNVKGSKHVRTGRNEIKPNSSGVPRNCSCLNRIRGARPCAFGRPPCDAKKEKKKPKLTVRWSASGVTRLPFAKIRCAMEGTSSATLPRFRSFLEWGTAKGDMLFVESRHPVI